MGRAWISVVFTALTVTGVAQNASTDKANSVPDTKRELGTVCVQPNSSNMPTLVSPGGLYNPSTLAVRIDKGQPILWPHKLAIKIEALNLDKRHLMVLTSDGKRLQSFWFRFTDYKDTKLCLNFDGYQGVRLNGAEGPLRCKCK